MELVVVASFSCGSKFNYAVLDKFSQEFLPEGSDFGFYI